MPVSALELVAPGTVHVARQPIFDLDGEVRAYELLHRRGGPDQGVTAADVRDGAGATREVILSALVHWGLDELVGERRGWVNVPSSMLVDQGYAVLDPDRVVLEVLEDTVYDDRVARGLRQAAERGFELALDDVVSAAQLPPAELSALFSWCKVDVLAVAAAELEPLVHLVRERLPDVALLAEKVEDRAVRDRCAALGFERFQGFFFAQPQHLARRAATRVRPAASPWFVECSDPRLDIEGLERIVLQDASFAVRVLSMVNSSAIAPVSPISSVRQAIVLLGVERVRQLALLLAVATGAEADTELVRTAAMRAHVAHLVMQGTDAAAGAVVAALLSVADAIYGVPMTEVVAGLRLAPDIVAALVGREGPLGALLAMMDSYERDVVPGRIVGCPADPARFPAAYAMATRWADQVMHHAMAA